MGLNFKKRILINETVFKNCENCKMIFPNESKFCTSCGSKLTQIKSQVYANMGKNGISSVSFKLANGITINSKGNITVPIEKGVSYTHKNKI